MSEILLLLVTVFSAVGGLSGIAAVISTFVLARRLQPHQAVVLTAEAAKTLAEGKKIEADALAVFHTTVSNMALTQSQTQKLVFDLQDGLFKSQVARQEWQTLADKRLLIIDGMPQDLLDALAENLRLKQKAAGLPDKPGIPDPVLTELAAEVKEAEERQPQTGKKAVLETLADDPSVAVVEAKAPIETVIVQVDQEKSKSHD